MVVMEEAVVEGAAASEDVNLVELMNARARSYGMLARLFREEIDLATLRELQKMRFPQATGNAAADEGHADTSRNFSSEKRCVFTLAGQLGGSDRPACRRVEDADVRCLADIYAAAGQFEYARRFGSDPGDGLTDHVGAVAMFHGPFQGERQEQFQSGGARGGFAERQEFFIVIDRRVVRADGVDRAIEQALRDGFTVFT